MTVPYVVFAVPTYPSSVTANFLKCAVETQATALIAGCKTAWMIEPFDPYLDKARNLLMTRFLRGYPDATDLFFLDDDVAWPAAKVVEFVNRDEKFLAGVYPKKNDQTQFPVIFSTENGSLIERAGLVQAKLVPAGFLRLKRSAVERLAEAADTLVDRREGIDREFYAICETGVCGESNLFHGEDAVLCIKWREMGGDIWIDPNIQFGHRGAKLWTGRLADHLPLYRQWASGKKPLTPQHDRALSLAANIRGALGEQG